MAKVPSKGFLHSAGQGQTFLETAFFFFYLSFFLSFPSLNIHPAFACRAELLWAPSAIFLQTHIFICFWLFMLHSDFITHIPRKTLIQEANESN